MSLAWATWPPIRWDQILEPSKPPEEEEDEEEKESQIQQLHDQDTLIPAPNQGHSLPTSASINQGHNLPTSINQGHNLPISTSISKGHDSPISAKSTSSIISQGQKQPIHWTKKGKWPALYWSDVQIPNSSLTVEPDELQCEVSDPGGTEYDSDLEPNQQEIMVIGPDRDSSPKSSTPTSSGEEVWGPEWSSVPLTFEPASESSEGLSLIHI